MAAPQARWSALLEMLTRDGRIEVEPAAEELRVSAATIRRDLDDVWRYHVRRLNAQVAVWLASDLLIFIRRS